MIGERPRDLRTYMVGQSRGRSHPGQVYYQGKPVNDPAPPQPAPFKPGQASIPEEGPDDD